MKKLSSNRVRHIVLFLCAGIGLGAIILSAAIRTAQSPNKLVPGLVHFGLPSGNVPDSSKVVVLHLFLQKMDSLEKDVNGKSLYDSICRRRPGLLDSVRAAIILSNSLK